MAYELEHVRDYILVGQGGQTLNCRALTASEARDSNLELECEGRGTLYQWVLCEQSKAA